MQVVPKRSVRVWGVLRVVLVLLWVAGCALSWWTAPRKQALAQISADISAGRVVAYQWGDSWQGDNGQKWFGRRVLNSSGELGPLFVWRTPDGQVRWADTYDFESVQVPEGIDSSAYEGVGAAVVGEQLQAAGIVEGGQLDPYGRYLDWLGPFFGLVFLVVLLAGPAPALGTKWFWFWLVLLAPYGMGLVFWLVRDRPWSRTAARTGRRDRGGLGFVIGALSAIAVSLLLLAIRYVLGEQWVPSAG